jgi:hypothetical protein
MDGNNRDSDASTSAEGPNWREDKGHSKRFEYLLESGLSSDVTFLVGVEKVEVRAHKFILKIGSPVFEKLFKEEGESSLIPASSAGARAVQGSSCS